MRTRFVREGIGTYIIYRREIAAKRRIADPSKGRYENGNFFFYSLDHII